MMPSNHPILLSSIFPSIRVFSNESALRIKWPKYWNFSFSPSNEYSELVSFRIDWFDLLAVQRDLQESSPAPQYKSITSSAFRLLHDPALMSVHDYWKNHVLTIWTFVHKVMSLLFNMLSRCVIAFLPRSKYLLISWPQSPSAVILEPKKRPRIYRYLSNVFHPVFLLSFPYSHLHTFEGREVRG